MTPANRNEAIVAERVDVDAITDLVSRALALRATKRTVLIGIDGLGGAGKSTLAKVLSRRLLDAGAPVAVVHGDDFYLPSDQRPTGSPDEKPIGSDFDWRRLRDCVLGPLQREERARYEAYDWSRDVLGDTREIGADTIVVVEGVCACRPELVAFYDVRVWVDCPRELRLARGLARDGEGLRARWEGEWMPAEDRYVAECRPREHVDLVVSGARAVDFDRAHSTEG